MATTVDMPQTATEKSEDKSRQTYNKAKDAYFTKRDSQRKTTKY